MKRFRVNERLLGLRALICAPGPLNRLGAGLPARARRNVQPDSAGHAGQAEPSRSPGGPVQPVRADTPGLADSGSAGACSVASADLWRSGGRKFTWPAQRPGDGDTASLIRLGVRQTGRASRAAGDAAAAAGQVRSQDAGLRVVGPYCFWYETWVSSEIMRQSRMVGTTAGLSPGCTPGRAAADYRMAGRRRPDAAPGRRPGTSD